MNDRHRQQSEASLSNGSDTQSAIFLDLSAKERKLRILHVDDDASFLEVTKNILTLENNFEVESAKSVDEAFRKIENTQYDAIISDLEMPSKNGLDFLKELKTHKKDIPFILFTGKGREEIAIRTLNLGADGYVSKQGDPETVYCELAHYIKQSVEKNQAKLALRESEERYRTLYESSQDALMILEPPNWNFTAGNFATIKMFGAKSEEEFTSKKPYDLSPKFQSDGKLSVEKAIEMINIALEKGSNFFEWTHKRINGEEFAATVLLTKMDLKGKKVLQATVRDMTEQRTAQNALRESQYLIDRIRNSTPNLIYIYDLEENRNVYANREVLDFLGYTPQQINEMGSELFSNILHPEDVKRIAKHHDRLRTASDEDVFEINYRMRHSKGKWRWLHSRDIPFIRSDDGKVKQILGFAEDISQLKRAEQELKETEEKYQTLFEQAGDYILTLEVPPKGVPIISDANVSALHFHGYSRNEIIGKPLTFIDQESGIPTIMERTKRLLNNEKLIFEAKHRRKDGTILNAEVSIKKVKVGSKTFLVSVERDLTHRKKIEDEIKKERDMVEAVTKSIGAGFIVISKDYHILWANNFIREYKGEVDGKFCYSVLNTLDKPCSDCGVTKIFAGKTTEDSHEYCSTTVDGRPYWVDIIATPIKNKDGNIVAASELAIDITEKKQREKDLKGSQQEFKALFNSNPEAVVYADECYNFVDVNPKFTEIFGYAPIEVKGKNLIEVLVPNDLRQEEQVQAEKSLTQTVSFESKRKCKNGSLLNVQISLAPVLVGNKRIGTVAVCKDMSNIMAAEQKIEDTLKQSQILNEKLNVIGSFTRHDVRNKLAAINGNVYLAKKNAGENTKLQNYLSQIKLASDNVTRILEFAKNYESLGKEERSYVNVGKAVAEAASLFADLKSVEIINSCRELEILADSMLTTVFHNLIDNSLKYGEKLTKIEIHTRKEQDGSETIICEDNGAGIDEETKKQLFTKGFGKGTGYGLYLIRRTCDIYGWTVKETGEPGKGARFEFNIPPNQRQKENQNLSKILSA